MIQIFSCKKFKNTNSFLIYNEEGKGILIDTCYLSYTDILSFILEKNIKITDIFITHGHFDHFYGINEICENQNHPNVYISKDDLLFLFDPRKNTSLLYEEIDLYAAKPIKNLKVISNDIKTLINGYNINIYLKIGHTNGSLIFDFEELNCLFIGDLIYNEFDGLNLSQNDKIKEKEILRTMKWLFQSFSKKYSIFPGHHKYGFLIRNILEEENILKKYYIKLLEEENRNYLEI
ncbi:MBL fold metallo-hydrolase [Spiroplasma taiwanense]|uniref:Metallo-beta-lactamase domain-containing protein n=1 Tax=Spiroplasma taiwanense CT-1 TaxID=1276220 RepID=S5LZV3_9MOLU|nr:MBL fold metallo-hydrolase [Spiroplasma taiwanense]AGR41252.1 hypothetical protein STAIW_v1c06330 [Spiroplasma taiwanense CT-1]